jgi:hypothetical protein
MHKYKYISLLLICLLLVSVVNAQSDVWKANEGGTEFNCTLLDEVIAAFNDGDRIDDLGDTILARMDDGDFSVFNYIGAMASYLISTDNEQAITSADILQYAVNACTSGEVVEVEGSDETDTVENTDFETFNVVATGNANMRSCGSTDCEIVAQASNGQLMVVIGIDEDWYEIQLDDGTAWIVDWLTVRGPDDVIITDERFNDERTGCTLFIRPKRGDMEVRFILSGDNKRDITADLYRTGDTNPLNVEGQLDKNFTDTDEPYIDQYYSWGLYWPTGVYNIEFEFGGETSMLAWEVEDRDDYVIFIDCD